LFSVSASSSEGADVELKERLAQLLDAAPADAPAVTYQATSWTWGDLRRLRDALGAELDRTGLGPSARVGVVLENRPAHVAVVVSLIATGRCLTALSPLQPAAKLVSDLERTEVGVVVASPEQLALPGVREAIALGGRAVALAADGALRPEADGARPGDSAFADPDTAVEMLTSGTTGPPKRVRLTHSQLDVALHSAHIRARSHHGRPILGSGTVLVGTPLVHISGLWGILAATFAGRHIALLDRFRLAEWVGAVERFRPRAAGLVPAAMRTVLDARVEPARLSSLQVVTSGTAPCPADLAEEFTRTYGPKVLMTYGATEFAGAVAGWTLPLHEQWWARKRGSAGRAFPGVQIRVRDDDGGVLPTGEVGHIEVLTRQAPNGGADWIRTSDLGRLDEDGFLWITGRADQAIIRGGFKVHPDVVKRCLEQHDGVLEAAVVGLPDDRLGQVPAAAVEPRLGRARPTVDELSELCRRHLTPYERPTQILVVDALPRTPSMKVSRVELLEMFGVDGATDAAPTAAATRSA
jgi:acyl-CoA synthetase (AMP-forming)/AMP-acid ligase II